MPPAGGFNAYRREYALNPREYAINTMEFNLYSIVFNAYSLGFNFHSLAQLKLTPAHLKEGERDPVFGDHLVFHPHGVSQDFQVKNGSRKEENHHHRTDENVQHGLGGLGHPFEEPVVVGLQDIPRLEASPYAKPVSSPRHLGGLSPTKPVKHSAIHLLKS